MFLTLRLEHALASYKTSKAKDENGDEYLKAERLSEPKTLDTQLIFETSEYHDLHLGEMRELEMPRVNMSANANLYFPTGMGVFVGLSGMGKTLLMSYSHEALTQNKVKSKMIRFCEPELFPEGMTSQEIHVGEQGIPPILDANVLLDVVADALVGPSKTIFIDSFREVVYAGGGGATGKGGINMGIFAQLTKWSVLASMLNKSLNVAFNPLTTDVDAIALLKEAMTGSVMTVYYLSDLGQVRMQSRAPGWKRAEKTISYTREGLIKKLRAQAEIQTESEFYKIDDGTRTYYQFGQEMPAPPFPMSPLSTNSIDHLIKKEVK